MCAAKAELCHERISLYLRYVSEKVNVASRAYFNLFGDSQWVRGCEVTKLAHAYQAKAQWTNTSANNHVDHIKDQRSRSAALEVRQRVVERV